ncbi:hypothetical protein GCM10009665_00370 [Kitasatospora nipponensis]|uniref:Secreted protein n=1 Tax=Kitasatospora nipponensis TaxID=258049 RepID=A0ABN1VK11_9ACTN
MRRGGGAGPAGDVGDMAADGARFGPGGPRGASSSSGSSGGSPGGGQERIRTEFEFELPRGYLDAAGTVHRHGAMRLATARDELTPLVDLRVKENPAYLSVVLLGLVVTRIGTITEVHAGIVEQLFASDLAFLQDFYQRINAEGHTRAAVVCPACQSPFEIDLAGGRLGES